MDLGQKNFEPKPFGRYVLLDKLAVGGMAEIYKAKTYGIDGFEKLLAIKRILPHCSADREFINMLVDEAKLTVLLSHANIVQVYDLGKVGDDYFISMEYIYGTNLREFMNRFLESSSRMPEELAVYIISEVCKGLDYAHRKADTQGNPLNIVHRDISPQNILISYEGEVKIVDFGIAKAAMNVSHTMAGILKGKVAYMSPEQALGKPIDHRTDIFSVGVLIYEMLTGEKLFTGETQFEVLNQIRTTRINTLMLPDHISGALKGILAKALAYNTKDRYQNAGDLQLDLTKYLYSSYVDFSPRNLASLLKKLFETEIRKKESPVMIDEKTSSAIIQNAFSEDILAHRKNQENQTAAISSHSKKIDEKTMLQKTVSEIKMMPETQNAVQNASQTNQKTKKSWLPWLLVFLVIASAAGYGLYRYRSKPIQPNPPTQPNPPPPPPVSDELGSLVIDSEPQGAKIFLNDKDTGLVTPTTLSKLSLGEEYKIRLSKEHFTDVMKSIPLTSSKPVEVKEKLQAILGKIEITSTPTGAKIFINETDSGKVTPTAIESLETSKPYAIKLVLTGYETWLNNVEVKDEKPVTVTATLTPVATINPPPPPPPPPPVTYGKASISSEPSGAAIFLNGTDTKLLTPNTLDKLTPSEKASIILKKSGYEDWKQELTPEADKIANVSATLKKITTTPPPPPPPPVTYGKASISSEPSGAAIYLNGSNTGFVTPHTLEKLAVSKKASITLKKSGYEDWKQTITPESEKTTPLTASLKKIEQTPPPPPPPPPPSNEPGSITVNSDPSGADVYINGDLKGTTPFSLKNIPSGNIKLVVTKEGSFRYSTTFKLGAGETKNLGTVKLGNQFGEVKLSSSPPRAKVYFDGQLVQTTPVTINKVPRNGPHTIRLHLDGFKDWEKTINLQDQEKIGFDVTLEKE